MMLRVGMVLGLLGLAMAAAILAGARAGLLVLLGVGFGVVLQASRFGFTTGWRELIRDGKPVGFLAQLLLIGLAATATTWVLGMAAPGEVVGAVAPIGASLLVGALIFGFAMQLADGCGSGTLYKAGAGAPLTLVVLPTFILGSFVGASHLPAWQSVGPSTEAPILLDLNTTLLICLVLALAALLYARWRSSPIQVQARWVWGALLLAALYLAHLVVAGQPWGIVYGLGLWGAKAALALGWNPLDDAFWGVAPHLERLGQPLLWDTTSLTNIGLMLGASVAAFWPRSSAPEGRGLRPIHWLVAALAGLAMGYSSRMALGCNIGAFLAGTASGSLHGWVWLVMAFLGSRLAVPLRQRIQMP